MTIMVLINTCLWVLQVFLVNGQSNGLVKPYGPIRIQKAGTHEFNIPSNKLSDFIDSLKKSLSQEGVDIRTVNDGEELPPFIRNAIYSKANGNTASPSATTQKYNFRRYNQRSPNPAYNKKGTSKRTGHSTQNNYEKLSQPTANIKILGKDLINSKKRSGLSYNPQRFNDFKTASTNIGFVKSNPGPATYDRQVNTYSQGIASIYKEEKGTNNITSRYPAFMRVMPDLNGWRNMQTSPKDNGDYWKVNKKSEDRNLLEIQGVTPSKRPEDTHANVYTYNSDSHIDRSVSHRQPLKKSVSSSLEPHTFIPIVYNSDRQFRYSAPEKLKKDQPVLAQSHYEEENDKSYDYNTNYPKWPNLINQAHSSLNTKHNESTEQVNPPTSANFAYHEYTDSQVEKYNPRRDTPQDPHYTTYVNDGDYNKDLDYSTFNRNKRDVVAANSEYDTNVAIFPEHVPYLNAQSQFRQTLDVNKALFNGNINSTTFIAGKGLRSKGLDYKLIKTNLPRLREHTSLPPSIGYGPKVQETGEFGCCEKLQEIEVQQEAQARRRETRTKDIIPLPSYTIEHKPSKDVILANGLNSSSDFISLSVDGKGYHHQESHITQSQKSNHGYGYDGYEDYQSPASNRGAGVYHGKNNKDKKIMSGMKGNGSILNQNFVGERVRRPFNDISFDYSEDRYNGISDTSQYRSISPLQKSSSAILEASLPIKRSHSQDFSYEPTHSSETLATWSLATTDPSWAGKYKGRKSSIVTQNSPKVTNVQVKCDYYKNQMAIRLKFGSPFNGVIYAKGFYKIKNCRIKGQGETTIVLNLPLTGCGMKTISNGHNLNTGKMKIDNTIIVMFDSLSGVLEAWDTAFRTSCLMGGGGPNKLKARVDVPMLDTTKDVQPDAATLPPAWMKIVKGKDPHGEPANLLRLGEIGTLVISSAMLNGFLDIFAFDCYAHDGMGMGVINLLDSNGCPLHGKLIGPQGRTEHDIQAVLFAHFKVFKFPDIQNVFFECSIKFCYRRCPPVSCIDFSLNEKGNSGPSKKYREKRELSTPLTDLKMGSRDISTTMSRMVQNSTFPTQIEKISLFPNDSQSNNMKHFNNITLFHIFQSVVIEMPEENEDFEGNFLGTDMKGSGSHIYDFSHDKPYKYYATENLNPLSLIHPTIDEFTHFKSSVKIKANPFCLSRLAVNILYIMMGIMGILTIILSSILYWTLLKNKDLPKTCKKNIDTKSNLYMENKLSLKEFFRNITQSSFYKEPIMVSSPHNTYLSEAAPH